jgi:hypothetical protein
MKGLKVTISERALVQRVKRQLAKDGKRLCSAQPLQRAELGAWFIVDTGSGYVSEKNIDLVKLARKLGVLKSWEQVAQ